MIDTALKLTAGLMAVLLGGLVAGVGMIHVVVVRPVWLVAFSAVAIVGLAAVVWGGRTLLGLVRAPRPST